MGVVISHMIITVDVDIDIHNGVDMTIDIDVVIDIDMTMNMNIHVFKINITWCLYYIAYCFLHIATSMTSSLVGKVKKDLRKYSAVSFAAAAVAPGGG